MNGTHQENGTKVLGWRTVVSVLAPTFGVLAFFAIAFGVVARFYLADRDAMIANGIASDKAIRKEIQELRSYTVELKSSLAREREDDARGMADLITEASKELAVLRVKAASEIAALNAENAIVRKDMDRIKSNVISNLSRLGVVENQQGLRIFRKPGGRDLRSPEIMVGP